MRVEYYNPINEQSGCIVRSISRALNKNYLEVKKEISDYAREKDYHEEEVFQSFLLEHGFTIDLSNQGSNLLELDVKGINIVLAKDNDWYHMICVIDNVIYDKNNLEDLKNLKVIKIYKSTKLN